MEREADAFAIAEMQRRGVRWRKWRRSTARWRRPLNEKRPMNGRRRPAQHPSGNAERLDAVNEAMAQQPRQ